MNGCELLCIQPTLVHNSNNSKKTNRSMQYAILNFAKTLKMDMFCWTVFMFEPVFMYVIVF